MSAGTAVKKPVGVDFYRVHEKDLKDLSNVKSWVESFGQVFDEHFIGAIHHDWQPDESFNLFVKTLEGTSYGVPEGYAIIRGVSSEYYPCEWEIFLKTYNIITHDVMEGVSGGN